MWFAVVVAAGLIVAALALDLRFLELVTTAIVPASPVLIWAIRERFRQKDTAEAQERLKGEAESFWDRAKEGGCDDGECAARSREFQNSIYARRASSPLILPFVYSLRRGRMEVGMKVGAEAMLAEAGVGTEAPPADAWPQGR